ncbi:MAG: hypothetical protein JJU06_21750 [Ectothiorhodospiraceae bacterium]|nr:hypothetical protein [Ectothiorhodospiraceae bacterium]MCH8505782.1 hypothetical protein [Ectothiorhodospiraceae bacterium]
MNKIVYGVLIGGVLVWQAQALADAPQWRSDPRYGTVSLQGGFSPDPHSVDVRAGGGLRVDSSLAPDCAGSVAADRPDVDLNFEPGSMALFIYVRSKVDTSLVIYGPDRRWYCNDDFMGEDPMVVFHNPPAGNYNIWVGTWDDDDLGAEAVVNISEINPAR